MPLATASLFWHTLSIEICRSTGGDDNIFLIMLKGLKNMSFIAILFCFVIGG